MAIPPSTKLLGILAMHVMKKDSDFESYEIQRKKALSKVLKLLNHASKNSPYYKKLLTSKKINISKIKNYEDFKKFPFTTSDDLKKHNREFLAMPLDEIWQIFSTSGTTGEPKFYFYDQKRIKILGPISKTVLKRVGLTTKGLVSAIFFPLDALSGGGPISARTCETLGVPIIGFGISPPAEVVAGRLRKLKPNWFFIFPSTFAKLTKELKEMDFNPKELDVKVMFSSGEPLNPNVRKMIQDFFNPKHIVDILASVEIAAYIASECGEHNGLHFLPFSVFSEVIDLETEKLIEGGVGELVLSSIEAYGTPMFRYKTGDVVKISKEKCKCGRNIPRIWVLGRVDDRVTIEGGRKFYVSVEINQFIKQFPDLTPNYQFIIENKEGKENIILRIESKNKSKELTEKVSEGLVKFSNPLSLAYSQGMLLKPVVELLDINSLERTRGKVKDRVVDKRR